MIDVTHQIPPQISPSRVPNANRPQAISAVRRRTVVTWFGVACGLEAVIAYAVARTGHLVGRKGQGAFTGLSALLFAALAAMMLVRDVT